MFEPISSREQMKPLTACRRASCGRQKIQPAAITCWSHVDRPSQVPVIEADVRGARLMLPWDVAPGQQIAVSVGNAVGLYETRRARIVWTQKLETTGRVIAGVAFDYELPVAV